MGRAFVCLHDYMLIRKRVNVYLSFLIVDKLLSCMDRVFLRLHVYTSISKHVYVCYIYNLCFVIRRFPRFSLILYVINRLFPCKGMVVLSDYKHHFEES